MRAHEGKEREYKREREREKCRESSAFEEIEVELSVLLPMLQEKCKRDRKRKTDRWVRNHRLARGMKADKKRETDEQSLPKGTLF